MKKNIHLLLVIGALLAFSGCAKKMHTYSVSSENVLVLKGLLSKSADVGIGEFTDSGRNQNATTCRMATPMETPNGETFAEYIKNAFRKELIVSEMFSHDPKVILTGNLNSINGSTALGDAYWDFDLTLKSSNGKEFVVQTRHEYASSFTASAACFKMQASFPIAVRKLVNQIILDPQFVSLLEKKEDK